MNTAPVASDTPGTPSGRERTDNGDDRALDRLVAFSDAVVAIAITLVVLPIVDTAMDAGSAGAFFEEDWMSVVSAALSFVVISVLWRGHHRLMRFARGYTPWVLRVEILWLAAIVWLPVATVLDILGSGNDRLALGIYVERFWRLHFWFGSRKNSSYTPAWSTTRTGRRWCGGSEFCP